MENIRKYIAAALFFSAALTSQAQELNSAYFTEGYTFRHTENPAIGNDRNYISVPGIGNVNVGLHGNFGLDGVLWENQWGPEQTTTFLNPNISVEEALSKFNDGDNKVQGDIKLTLLSVGFKKWNGYNTVELSSKTSFGAYLPYALFEFAKNTGNERYNIGDVGASAQSYVELAFGHSRQFNEHLRLGAKLKVLFGVARADLKMENVTADLTGQSWTVGGYATADVMMKGFHYLSEDKDYKSHSGTYPTINDFDIDGGGIGGMGLAIDLGGVYKINDDFTVSAALTDLGFIHWSEDMQACNDSKTFVFGGFHDLGMHTGDGTFDERTDEYTDQIMEFVNLRDMGDKGGASRGIAATMRIGGEYTLQVHRPLTFGLLSTTRLNGKYTWTEGRLSANYHAAKWLDGGLSVALGTFGASSGWVINIHPKPFNLFIGMDHILGKTAKQMVPLTSNASLNVGLNVIW